MCHRTELLTLYEKMVGANNDLGALGWAYQRHFTTLYQYTYPINGASNTIHSRSTFRSCTIPPTGRCICDHKSPLFGTFHFSIRSTVVHLMADVPIGQ